MFEKMYLHSAVFFACALLFSGCISYDSQSASTNNAPQATPQQNTPTQFNIGEIIHANDYSFVASAWGFAPLWCEKNPQEGAEFLWIRINTTNTGTVPITTDDIPNDFSVKYRGTETSRITMQSGCEEYRFTIHGTTLSIPPKQYFPGTSNTGYIVFQVPVGLKDNEPSLSVTIEGKPHELQLHSPTPFSGEHLLIKNARFDSCRITRNVPYHEYACDFIITVMNDADVLPPVLYGSEGIEIVPLIGNSSLIPTTVTILQKPTVQGLGYMETREITTPYIIFARDAEIGGKPKNFWVGQNPIGAPGEVVQVHICDSCSPDPVNVELPALPPEFE